MRSLWEDRMSSSNGSTMIDRFVGATIAAAAVAACSSWAPTSLAPSLGHANGQSANRTITRSAGVRIDEAGCPTSVVYIVSSGSRVVEIYDASKLGAGPCGSVSGLSSPQGIFVDSKSRLWVADSVAQKIFEFAPPKTAPIRTLSDPSGNPNDVVVDASSGTAYVTDYRNNVNPSKLVEVYAKGSSTPTGSLSDANARNGAFDAIDDKGNLYVTFMRQDNKAQVDRWMGGAGSPQNLNLKLISAGGIVTTVSGALAVCDPFAFRCGIFEPGTTTMSHVFGHMGRFAEGMDQPKPPFLHPNSLGLDRGEHLAYVAANTLSSWRYPGPAHRPDHLPIVEIKIPGVAGQGVAANPASRPGTPF
jgi:hypothetical protein